MSLEFWVEAPLKQQVHHKEEKGHLTKTGTVEKGSTVTHKTNKQKNQMKTQTESTYKHISRSHTFIQYIQPDKDRKRKTHAFKIKLIKCI